MTWIFYKVDTWAKYASTKAGIQMMRAIPHVHDWHHEKKKTFKEGWKKNCGHPESFQVNNLREIKELVVTYAMFLKIMEAKMWPIFQDLRIRHINIALINESWHQSLNVQCIYNQIYFTGMTSIPYNL